MSTIEGFHCIQDTSPGPQGVHNGGVPLYYPHQHDGEAISAIAAEEVEGCPEVGALELGLHGGAGLVPETSFLRSVARESQGNQV